MRFDLRVCLPRQCGGPAALPQQCLPLRSRLPDRPPAGAQWSDLSADQQKLLERFEEDWSTLPPAGDRRHSRAAVSAGCPCLRKSVRTPSRDLQRWRDLPATDRQQLRDRWNKFQSLPPEERESVRDNFRKFKNMSPERRQRLHDRWEKASPDERQRVARSSTRTPRAPAGTPAAATASSWLRNL